MSLCLCGFFFPSSTLAQALPVFSDSGPDADAYGKADGYPAGPFIGRPQRYLVGNASRWSSFSHRITGGEAVWQFKRADKEAAVTFTRRGKRFDSIADYMADHPVTGLLVAKDDMILYEHYQYARSDADRLVSHSMAKTVTAMLVGIAVSEGAIKSLDDLAEAYVPALKGKEYGRTQIRALLHMASGIEFREDYGGTDDMDKFLQGLRGLRQGASGADVIGQFNARLRPPDVKFAYASIETQVLGLVLAKAIGKPVADYLTEKIWRPIGAERDAYWTTDATGQEWTFCCIYATVRDYARIGRLLAYDGAWNGKQIIPRQWVIDASSVKPGDKFLEPRVATGYYGYGYQTWIFPGARRMFALQGIHGQRIYVDPDSKLVMVQTAVRKNPSNDPADADTVGLWMALVDKYGKD